MYNSVKKRFTGKNCGTAGESSDSKKSTSSNSDNSIHKSRNSRTSSRSSISITLGSFHKNDAPKSPPTIFNRERNASIKNSTLEPRIDLTKNNATAQKNNVQNASMSIDDEDSDLEYLRVAPEEECLKFVNLYKIYKLKIENAGTSDREKISEELKLKIEILKLTPQDMHYEMQKQSKEMNIIEGGIIEKWNEYGVSLSESESNTEVREKTNEDFLNFLMNGSQYKSSSKLKNESLECQSFNKFLRELIKDVEDKKNKYAQNKKIIVKYWNEYIDKLDNSNGNKQTMEDAGAEYSKKIDEMVECGISLEMQYNITEEVENKKDLLGVLRGYTDALKGNNSKAKEEAYECFLNGINRVMGNGLSIELTSEILRSSKVEADTIENVIAKLKK